MPQLVHPGATVRGWLSAVWEFSDLSDELQQEQA